MITEAEVAEHNNEKDCWFICHDLVIKMDEELIKEHPGGPDIMFAFAGKNATEDFEDIAHSDKAREWADNLIIGYTEGASEDTKKRMKLPTLALISGGGGGAMKPLYLIVPLIAILGAALAFLRRRR